MDNTTFEGARIGDKVFCAEMPYALEQKTNGFIDKIWKETEYKNIYVKFKCGDGLWFTVKGERVTSIPGKVGGRSLFWSNPITSVEQLPKRPTRKEKKEGYVLVALCNYDEGNIGCALSSIFLKPQEDWKTGKNIIFGKTIVVAKVIYEKEV